MDVADTLRQRIRDASKHRIAYVGVVDLDYGVILLDGHFELRKLRDALLNQREQFLCSEHAGENDSAVICTVCSQPAKYLHTEVIGETWDSLEAIANELLDAYETGQIHPTVDNDDRFGRLQAILGRE